MKRPHTKKRGHPFRGDHYFTVSLRLYESGFAAHLTGSQFKRYITLLRVANYNYGQTKIKADLKDLEELDGVSPRSAFEVHTKLQEFGLIQINKSTRPFTYTLWEPSLWEPPQTLKLRQFKRTDRIRVKTEFRPVSFKQAV